MTKDRQTSGMVPAVLIAVVSLTALTAMWRFEWPGARGLPLLVHGSAGLCLAWSLLGWLLTWRAKERLSSAVELDGRIAVLGNAAWALGLLAFIPMLYQAVLETILRALYVLFFLIFGPALQAHLWPSGNIDLALLAAALVLGRIQSGDRRLITALFWLVVFVGLWTALHIPAFRLVVVVGVPAHQVATHWSAMFMVWTACTLGAFTLAGGAMEYRRRLAAWPGELWKLTAPLPPWPGFHYSAGLAGVAVMVLGCVHVTLLWAALAAFLAGASMLALAGRRWNEDLADVGLALITLGAVSLVTVWRPEAHSASDYFAEIFNRVVIGLAIMVAFWHWLAHVWMQQLDNGVAWTASGRLVRTTRRVGYLLAITAVLVSMTLAVWPLLAYVDLDRSPWRWGWGLAGNGLLILAVGFSALLTGKRTLGWVTLLALASAVTFVKTRVGGLDFSLWWNLHWPVVLTGWAALALLVAYLIHRTGRWAPFWEALYVSGVLMLPMVAITGVSFSVQLRLPHWVPAATFEGLAGVYLLAAWLPGPRGYAVAAAICAAIGIYMGVV